MSNAVLGVRPDVAAHFLDGELVLLDELQSRLFALNPTASFIWSSLATGLDLDTIAHELSHATDVPVSRARADIETIVASWRDAHLLKGSHPPPKQPTLGDAPRPPHLPSAAGTVVVRAVKLMNRGLHIVSDPDLLSAVEMVFGHVFVPAREVGRDWPTLTVCRVGGRWVLSLNDELLAMCTERAEIIPMLYGNSARLIYEAADCFAGVHAAAVARNGRCVLLPAVSASGKSTLTAALIAAGYQYCTDDLAILTRAPTRLRPVPMKIGLKSGSWDLLAKSWPELASLPSHRRADGQAVKYLDPGHASRAGDDSLPVAGVVFPRFAHHSPAELRRISQADALARTAEAGYDLSGKLDRASVATLVSWFGTLECYELQFANLDEAVGLFDSIMG